MWFLKLYARVLIACFLLGLLGVPSGFIAVLLLRFGLTFDQATVIYLVMWAGTVFLALRRRSARPSASSEAQR